ncbi:MAG: copper resistance protein CopC [Methylobacteriaceae bacterium]|nr:copper resistance protein CopC [Methylobacteriaceae bacterium]
MKIIVKTVLAGALVLTGAAAAHAHAQLQSADPRVGSIVRAAPPVLTLNFSEAVEAALSSVQVTDAAGRRVDAGRMRPDKGNSQQVQVPLRALPAGQYNVHWRVISVDTHKTEGSFGFEVRP